MPKATVDPDSTPGQLLAVTLYCLIHAANKLGRLVLRLSRSRTTEPESPYVRLDVWKEHSQAVIARLDEMQKDIREIRLASKK